jgi:hypothetical protein
MLFYKGSYTNQNIILHVRMYPNLRKVPSYRVANRLSESPASLPDFSVPISLSFFILHLFETCICSRILTFLISKNEAKQFWTGNTFEVSTTNNDDYSLLL